MRGPRRCCPRCRSCSTRTARAPGVRAGQRRPDVLRHRRHARAGARRRRGRGAAAPVVGVAGVRPAGLGGGGRRGGQRGRAPARRGARACSGRAAGCWCSARARRTPAELAALLAARGWGASRLTVLEQLGGPAERRLDGTAAGLAASAGRPVEPGGRAAPRPGAAPRLVAPGLPDDAFDHDGQLTKREVRAVTLAAARPAARRAALGRRRGRRHRSRIEWMRAHPTCRAVAVEPDPDRAARIAANADALGRAGRAGRARPGARRAGRAADAGRGVRRRRRHRRRRADACWEALPAGGRLVANAVTVESEAVLAAGTAGSAASSPGCRWRGPRPVGGFTGWRPAMPVTIWSVAKP